MEELAILFLSVNWFHVIATIIALYVGFKWVLPCSWCSFGVAGIRKKGTDIKGGICPSCADNFVIRK